MQSTNLRKRGRAHSRISRAVVEPLEQRQLFSVTALTMDAMGNCSSSYGVTGTPSENPSDAMTSQWNLTIGGLMQHTHLSVGFQIGVERTDPNQTASDTFAAEIDGQIVAEYTATPVYLNGWTIVTRGTPASNPLTHIADNATISIVPESMQPGDYFDVGTGNVFASGDISVLNSGAIGTWGYGGAGLLWRIFRDAAPNHAATVYLYFPDATVGTDPHGDTELYTTTATPLSTHPGYFSVTIPAGQTYVDVTAFPTDMIWTDGNGDLGGDANTPVTLDILHPSALGDPDDLEAYDSQRPISVGIMAKTTAGETWWAHVPDPAKPGQLKWQQIQGGGVGVTRGTNLDVRLKVAGQANVGYHAETKNDNMTGSAPFTVGPQDGNLDKTGSVVITIQVPKDAPANSGGYLVVTVASTPHKLHVTIK